ncbi:uncharacterized protein LOC125597395 isoform X2 [Brassica napus]|uniref:uncharacterized protein LOC125597395 isoform X2 n=1 Tax=Brassica napus TaxID=3708 RepID=UPI002078C12A|nr:uncharacterized protein LOC125597395 isoform X2 [Brassica napus]
MRARLVVFPIKGRKWCFSRSVDPFAAQTPSGVTPTTVRGLWKKLSSESKPINANAELLVDFISDKMNKAWTGLEKAPEGSMKNKIHGLGLKLLARVKPSEIFLKSISKEVTSIQVSYPPSLDPRLVRRRLRHIAMRYCHYQTYHSSGSCSAHIPTGELFREASNCLSSSQTKLMMQMNAITTRRSLNLPHVFCCHQRSYASYLVKLARKGLVRRPS